METILGVKTFITWYPPNKKITVGGIKISNGNGVIINAKTTNSTSQSVRSTVNLEYSKLAKGELSTWVLFHSFITGNPWTIWSYMQTIHGVVETLDKPLEPGENYDDFLNIAYKTKGISRKMSYKELYNKFISIDEKKIGMVKNLLLDMKPGPQYSHSELANYSYWRMVIDYSIIDAIVGAPPPCENTHTCSTISIQLQHYSVSAREWLKIKLAEIIDDSDKVEQYVKIIWAVRQNIRHGTVHASAYPYTRSTSQLQRGDNEFDIDTVITTFKKDTHALRALEQNMHEVTRILLLNNTLETRIFPDIRPYMIRSGGMNLKEFLKIINQ